MDLSLTGRLQVETMLDGYTELMEKSTLTEDKEHENKSTILKK